MASPNHLSVKRRDTIAKELDTLLAVVDMGIQTSDAVQFDKAVNALQTSTKLVRVLTGGLSVTEFVMSFPEIERRGYYSILLIE